MNFKNAEKCESLVKLFTKKYINSYFTYNVQLVWDSELVYNGLISPQFLVVHFASYGKLTENRLQYNDKFYIQ